MISCGSPSGLVVLFFNIKLSHLFYLFFHLKFHLKASRKVIYSSGLVVMGGDSRSEGREFDSRHH